MDILPNAEKLCGSSQIGGWQNVARRRHQKGNIRKRGKRNPVWELQFWADSINSAGEIIRTRESTILGYVSDFNKRQAQRAAEEFLQPINSGKQTPFSTILFRDFVEKHFIPLVLPNLKPSTRNNYRITLNTHLLPAFGNRKLCEIGTLEIQQFVLRKIEEGLGWESVSRFRNLLSTVFAKAKLWKFYGGDNPAAGVELPEKTAVREKQVLTLEQIANLLCVLQGAYRAMIAVGIFTGLRVGEILGLRWEYVDFERKQIHVRQTVYRGTVGTPKTKRSRRSVPMPEYLYNELAAHYRRSEQRDGPELVFQTRNGTAFSDTNVLHRVIKPAGKAIGAPWLNWHAFRRTLCTLFQEAGGSVKDAQLQLGHANAAITLEHYTVGSSEQQRLTVEKLAQLVTNGDKSAPMGVGITAGSQQIQ
jgi:integrase